MDSRRRPKYKVPSSDNAKQIQEECSDFYKWWSWEWTKKLDDIGNATIEYFKNQLTEDDTSEDSELLNYIPKMVGDKENA